MIDQWQFDNKFDHHKTKTDFEQYVKDYKKVDSNFITKGDESLQVIIEQNVVKLLMAFAASLHPETDIVMRPHLHTFEEAFVEFKDFCNIECLPFTRTWITENMNLHSIKDFLPELVDKYGADTEFDSRLILNRKKLESRGQLDGEFGLGLDAKGNFRFQFPIGFDILFGPSKISDETILERSIQFVLTAKGKMII